jgi:enamine deaminase RidA (YjgF/YER057c/UK114 family)
LGAPRGYSNGVLASAGGRLLFVAGQVAWDSQQKIVSSDFSAQLGQALENVITVVRAAGGGPEHIVRLVIYVTDKREYIAALKAVGAEYRRLMSKHFPAMALVEVAGLLEPGAKIEIEATAVLPAEDSR